jgi:hypothetical protein
MSLNSIDKFIKFYHLNPPGKRMQIEQSPVNRDWMTQTVQGYAYRCLPMTYANRHGWCIKLLQDVEVIWDGSVGAQGTKIVCGREQDGIVFADNGTGNGVVTFHFNAIPRTSKDWNLWIMGAPNLVIPGASPLSGIVESDWMFSSPTANWKITEPNKLIVFKKEDPVIFFIPIHKTELEDFTLEHKDIDYDSEEYKHFIEHAEWRQKNDEGKEESFGKAYLRGVRTDRTKPDWDHNHKTKLRLNEPDVNNGQGS